MKINPKKLEPLRQALIELREMARIEASIGDDSERAIQKVWNEVQAWADCIPGVLAPEPAGKY